MAAALKHIGEPSTDTVDGDILNFSNRVKQRVSPKVGVSLVLIITNQANPRTGVIFEAV